MYSPTSIAIIKLVVLLAVALGLLLVSLFAGETWYQPIALVTLIVVAAPVLLLVAIDTGRVLRRRRLGPLANAVALLPQVFLGMLAGIAGFAGLCLAALGTFANAGWRLLAIFISSAMVIYGASLLRGLRRAALPANKSYMDSSRK